MIQTLPNYRPFPTVRDVDFRIAFSVMDTNAKKDTTVLTASDPGVFNNPRATVNDVHEPTAGYIALERDLWRLDGAFSSLPDDLSGIETGMWSEQISGSDGVFAEPIVYRYTFSSPISTLGWTLTFDPKTHQHASRVKITAYGENGTTVLDTGEYDNNDDVMMLQHYVGDYYAVEFAFLATSEPLRRLRLTEVDFGLTKSYDRNALGSVKIIYGADVLSRSLPMRELVFTFDNADKQYNLLNPDGVYQYLQEGQEITASAVIGGVPVDMGVFRFTKADVSRSGIVPEITAHDAVYALDGSVFTGATGAEMTLSSAIAAVLGDFDLPVRYEGDIASRLVTLSPPADVSVRECVRLLAQAAMSAVYIDRAGTLLFSEMAQANSPVSEITADELYDYSGVSISDPVHGVKLHVTSGFEFDEKENPIRYTYTAGSLDVGAIVTSFQNPCVAKSAGASVAAWLLAGLGRRKNYAVKNRCDPAVEIGDTIAAADIFGNFENAVVTGVEIDYDGTLHAVTKGVGQ